MEITLKDLAPVLSAVITGVCSVIAASLQSKAKKKRSTIIIWVVGIFLAGSVVTWFFLQRQVEAIRLEKAQLTTDRNTLTADQARLREQERLMSLSACARLYLEPTLRTLVARIRKAGSRFGDDANWKTNGVFNLDLARRTVTAADAFIREAKEQYYDQTETCRRVFALDADKKACAEASGHMDGVQSEILNLFVSPPNNPVEFEAMRQLVLNRMTNWTATFSK